MPNKDCNGAKETEACVVCVSPGLCLRCTLISYCEGLPYPPSAATPWPKPLECSGKFKILGSPPSLGTGLLCAIARGTAAPVAAAANACRMKLRRPLLLSAMTVRIPSRSKKFSGAFCMRPEYVTSDVFTDSPSIRHLYINKY